MSEDLTRACLAVGNLAGEYERLRAAVRAASLDMHHASDRPCPTCFSLSAALREQWGCYAYQAKRGQSRDFSKCALSPT